MDVKLIKYGDHYVIICPRCQYLLAKGYFRGLTVTMFDKCPNCGTKLDWKIKEE